MLRVWVCTPYMDGLLAQISLSKGPFFGRFSLNMGGLSRHCRKLSKLGLLPPKYIIIKGEPMGSSRNVTGISDFVII